MAATYESKLRALRRRLQDLESAVVAFSGGVDSSVLAALAHEALGTKMVAATAVSASLPARDRVAAEALCRVRGIPHRLVETGEFADPVFLANPDDRCYHCKQHLYAAFAHLADDLGFRHVVEGTNASDLGGHRPGYRASQENGRVATPLIDAGFTKAEVRRLAAELGLSTADTPSSACLASRVPSGVAVTPELMRRIDLAEEAVRRAGPRQARVRHHGDLARIEVDEEGTALVAARRSEIVAALTALGWTFVTLDLVGYRTGGTRG